MAGFTFEVFFVNRPLVNRAERKAFSLVELLVVIALIGILSTLLIIGVDKLRTSGKRQQTHLTMLNLQAMFSEADAVRHLPFGIGHVSFNSVSPTNQAAIRNAVAMWCPENMTVGSPDRFGIWTSAQPTPNRAVRYTRDFMAMLMQFPGTATGIAKLPAGSLMTFPATLYNAGTPAAWAAGTTYNVARGSADSDLSDEASDGNAINPSYFVRTQLYTDNDGKILQDDNGANGDSAMGPPNPAYWLPALPPPPAFSPTLPLSTPVVLDAWGNPIIFVFGGFLGNGTKLVNGAVGANSGALMAGGQSVQIHGPDYRPFFASAGPDGDMSKGDDNMYSFEK